MCGAHATVRGFIGKLVEHAPASYDVVMDMEAGLEHLSRGTGRHVSRILAVVEPYYRSMETARRIKTLAVELGVAQVDAVANKVRDQADRDAIAEFCQAHGLPLIGAIAYDAELATAERAGRSPIDHDPHACAVREIGQLADRLLRAPSASPQ